MLRRNPFLNLVLVLFAAAIGFIGTLACAEDAPPFPTDAAAWINSDPLTVTGLKGKGVVMWFFEEECPKCRERWPALMEAAKKYDGEPIFFIAVNSGAPRGQIEEYVRECNVTWPVIVDPSRDFEKACGLIQEISLQNISQIRFIKPNGEILPGLSDDIDEAAKKAADGAAWKVEPTAIPAMLKETWKSIEMGNYKKVSATLKKSAVSNKADVKEAATKLMAVIQQEMTDQIAAINEAKEGNAFKAYELVTNLSERFAGYEIPKDVAQIKKELGRDSKVKAGITATKNLEQARKQLATGNAGAKKKAVETLKKIVADFPETALANHAQALLTYSD